MNIGKGMLGILGKAALLGTLTVSGAASAAGFTVANNLPPAVAKAKVTGHHNANEVLDIRVVLPLNNAAQFAQLLHDLYDKSSPNYRHFLTPAQFKTQFGPTDAQVAVVESSLRGVGIKVTGFSADNTRIHATAKVAVLEKAFGITINDYSYQGKSFYAPDTNPTMPASMTVPVMAVLGLDDAVTYQPHSMPGKAAPSPHALLGHQGYMPADINTFYDLPAASDPAAGAGVTIAVATVYNFRVQDLDTFWATSGVMAHNVTNGNPVTVVAVDGRSTKVLNAETTLDIQRSGSVAPGAAIEVYECQNPSNVNFDDEFNEIAADGNVQVATTSWGAPETEQSLSSIGSEHQSFVTMAVEGITMFAAAGDNSAGDGTGDADVADFPASDPYVVSAGGTFLPDLNNRNSETAWGTLVNGVGDPNGSGAGGADSVIFAEPDYQNSGVPNFVHNTSCVENRTGDSGDFGSDTGDLCAGSKATPTASRQNSDMALDGGTGYALFYNGRWVVFIGTSFVAPQLAGYFADVLEQAKNASATLINGRGLGKGDELIYCVGDNPTTYANDFFDVTSGSNGFPAGTGWDHPTGFGTILNGSSLATDLIGCLPP